MKGSLYSQPRMIWLILMLILVSGLNAIQVMPRLEDPHMQSRVVNVTTLYPGADAEQVEAEVTEKIERKMREIAEVKTITAVSNPGVSAITIELEDSVTDAKPITARLRDKVAEVTDLPDGIIPPDFSDTKIYAHSAVIALTWHADSPINYAIMGRLASELESRLRNMEPTDFVDIKGLPQEEIRIAIDDSELAAHGLTVSDVVGRIRGSDSRGSAGIVSSQNSRLTIEVAGALDSLARIRRIPLQYDERGAALRLGDVATVERTYQDPPSSLSLLNGHVGITISARMLENFRIDKWSESLKIIIDDFQKTIPASIHIDRIYDQADYTNERIDGLLDNLGVGALVVVIVLFISLGLRSSLIAASILPLTMLSALAILNIFGMRIEQVLIIGMIVSLGIMVDNAIVITDEVQHLLLKGERRAIAVAKTVKKLWLPLFGSTLTTIVAFLPLLLMPGAAGDFLKGVPAAVIASLISSYVIAFTLISALAGRVIRGGSTRDDFKVTSGRIWWRDGIEGKFLSSLFRASLNWSVNNPLKSVIVAMIVPICGFIAAGNLTDQFFPVSDRNQFRIVVNLPGDASIYETQQKVKLLDDVVRNTPKVQDVYWTIGDGSPKVFYNMIDNKKGIPSYAEAIVKLETFLEVEEMVPYFQRVLTEQFPALRITVRELGSGPPVQAPLEVRVVGPDLTELERIGEKVRSIMATIHNVTNTYTSMRPGRPQILVKAREDDVSVTGLTLSDVSQQLRSLSSGIIATHLIEETQRVPLKVVLDSHKRADIDNIANMNLQGRNVLMEADKSYKDVPLSALGDVILTTKVGTIHRRNGERINNIQGFIEFGVLSATITEELGKRIDAAKIDLPPGYRIEFGGESEKRGEAVGQLFGTVGILLVMMLIAVVLTFNSFRLAIVTLLAAVQAAGLGFLSLWFFDYPISFVVIIGLMGLIGLSINAAIVITSELRGRDAARAGSKEEVVEAVMSTGRHILSTTLTTVGGFMPLILAGGSFWPPFAVALAGGTFLSMIVSFYFAPAAFLWLTRRNEVSAPSGEGAPLRFKI
ncbi:efflux RND transporter permease subunit [Temperatibacter marinus]|uniref:Efflux RND transporter permease subunit n=1 Tax=Temperatibacter marinus TaxID=1456591 RepID=A0AA52EB31_9PROT|nr:efflux RND transporter permease subunit [Temperatibacter marinus]WND01561.1 efflux RND transporter permease subunit [Temperatibacter marinus]